MKRILAGILSVLMLFTVLSTCAEKQTATEEVTSASDISSTDVSATEG